VPDFFSRTLIRSVFTPPSLVLRQLGSVMYYAYLTRWRAFPTWLVRHGFDSLPVAAGAIGMGCIGFPNHPAWEVTTACNLKCIHCHASAGAPDRDELTTEEGRRLIDSLAAHRRFRMLVFTGGEPLVRPDIFELLEHAKKAGFVNVLATNATLIDAAAARRLKLAGVAAAAVSLDSCLEPVHNEIRKNPDAFRLAMEGIEALKRAGIKLQINITALGRNNGELEGIIELAAGLGAAIVLVYQLVPVGRGDAMRAAALDSEANRRLVETLARVQSKVPLIIEPVAAPQYWAYLGEREKRLPTPLKMWLARFFFHGCSAGRGFVYIKANGEVWPCPFVERSAGSIRERDFREIWADSPAFSRLRRRESGLQGKCGGCPYRRLCGGCRGRAAAVRGSDMSEDPSCFL
jgi:radical SAM protein with 4Fe4S-binding SPASM domain